MNLPNYFLADLPPEAALSATMISEACQTLKRNRERFLAERSTQDMIRVLSRVAENWREPEFPLRKLALESGPAATGFSRETLASGLDAFFAQVTADNLRALVIQDFAHSQRADSLVAEAAELKLDRASHARAPELLAHVTGGTLPNPALTSIVHGVLLRSAQFVKCASGTSLIPRLFAHSLYEEDRKLGACLEIAEWKGGAAHLEAALFAEADCVAATGSDETLATIRKSLPTRVRFLGYGHRVSFAFATAESVSGLSPRRVVEGAARDVAAWDQQGCLSPHVIYVETGGRISPDQFAALLAKELERIDASQPRRRLNPEEAASITSRRSFYEVRAAHSEATRLWCSEGSTAWTVVFEDDPKFQVSCLNRFIYVKSVADLTQVLEGADAVRGKVSTVGLAATEDRAPELANQLARWGVPRVCPLGRMQEPPLTWRHDGRPTLGDLVTWTDWEM